MLSAGSDYGIKLWYGSIERVVSMYMEWEATNGYTKETSCSFLFVWVLSLLLLFMMMMSKRMDGVKNTKRFVMQQR
eukprot:scaffold8271_cov171-Amphora_coffeaeformis.AAC.13